MKRLVCEMCGSTDILKDNGVFECQSCGTKYSVEEAKKMMVEGKVEVEGTVNVTGTVKIDSDDKLNNLYQVARRARDENHVDNAAEYYDMIHIEDPNSWEASFYVVYFKALQSKVAEIRLAANSITNCLQSVLKLLNDEKNDDDIMLDDINEIANRCILISDVFAGSTASNISDFGEKSDNMLAVVDILFTCGDLIEEIFSSLDYSVPCTKLWEKGIEFLDSSLLYFDTLEKTSIESDITSYLSKIQDNDKSFYKKYDSKQKHRRLSIELNDLEEKNDTIEKNLSSIKNELSLLDSSTNISKIKLGIVGGIVMLIVGGIFYIVSRLFNGYHIIFDAGMVVGALMVISSLVLLAAKIDNYVHVKSNKEKYFDELKEYEKLEEEFKENNGRIDEINDELIKLKEAF